MLARQTLPDEVLGEQDVRNAAIYFGFVLRDPQQFGRGEARQDRIAGQAQDAFQPACAPSDLSALRRSPLIVPEDGGSQDAFHAVK